MVRLLERRASSKGMGIPVELGVTFAASRGFEKVLVVAVGSLEASSEGMVVAEREEEVSARRTNIDPEGDGPRAVRRIVGSASRGREPGPATAPTTRQARTSRTIAR